MELGVRVFLHEMAGYKVTSTAAIQEVNPIDAIILGLQELKKVQEEQKLINEKLAIEAQRTNNLE